MVQNLYQENVRLIYTTQGTAGIGWIYKQIHCENFLIYNRYTTGSASLNPLYLVPLWDLLSSLFDRIRN